MCKDLRHLLPITKFIPATHQLRAIPVPPASTDCLRCGASLDDVLKDYEQTGFKIAQRFDGAMELEPLTT